MRAGALVGACGGDRRQTRYRIPSPELRFERRRRRSSVRPRHPLHKGARVAPARLGYVRSHATVRPLRPPIAFCLFTLVKFGRNIFTVRLTVHTTYKISSIVTLLFAFESNRI